MSDDPWKPIHHVEADDPEVQEGGGEQKPAPQKRESKGGGGESNSTVMLSLELPADFTKAVVTAIQENTKVLQAILAKMGGE
jgi:hypothetical protein